MLELARDAQASAFSLLSAGLVALPAPAQTTPPLVVAVDQLPKRAILTLGEFSAGNNVRAAIALRSELGKPLSIRSITSDCGCLRVDHDPQAATGDGSLMLEVELAPAKKIGRIRRNLRVFFDQEPSSPLDIGLDTLVVGPIAFKSASAPVRSSTETIEIAGIKSSPGVEVLRCEPTRGSCRVLEITQSAEDFSVRVRRLISFGSANELFRIRYQASGDSDEAILEVPMELRCVSPLRFFPSVASIQFDQGAWRSAAKLVLSPGTHLGVEPLSDGPLDLEQLQLSIEREDGSQWNPSDYRVELQQSSVVLYAMQITCSAPHRDSDPPTRLKVASPNGELLATLDFSSP